MNTIKILAETPESVTISRKDWADLLAGQEDWEDRAAIAERRSHEVLVGREAARRNYLTADEALRLLDGESPVKLWREKRELSQRQLATAASISASYLAEIEKGRKPGSPDAISKVAQILGVPKEDLTTELQRIRAPEFGPVSMQSWSYSAEVSPGNRGAGPEVRKFPTVRDAVEYIRNDWHRMSAHGVFVETEDGKVIYDLSDLWQEIDPGTYAVFRQQTRR